ncbi:MAG: hypothetical protein PUF92_08325 [Subdoligranulum variabile]|uniref:hypothetical protein n=2 Tax=Gemmiger sp. TaxID=2049027 RepID=UPI002A81F052|nr:hypothetical protein [Gemmiger sp.]MCI6385420.1 hypothetical protein [Subdoligranulum variabile]MDD6425460.1 hypothetical protein [Subdoligranulum variabile]MDD6608715.1 hypothetical protein [Subdoligranulum variabile]MDY4446729.1 hypothetical protein [Gemmiger sp.]
MMADRKNKHAYLDDFEKDLNGNYQYRGAHYYYKGTQPRGKALAGLWVLCGGGTSCLLAAGFVHGATAHAPFWLLLPYMAGLLAGVYVLYLLVRLTAGGDPLRAYIHEQTAQKLPGVCLAAAVLAALTAAAQLVQLALGGQNLAARLLFAALQTVAAAAFIRANKRFKVLKYEKQE